MKSILGNTRKADITFNRSGRINISSRVSKLLGLTSGDVIDIVIDEEETYLYVKHRAPVVGKHEGMVFCSNKNGHHFIASSITLCRYILSKSSGGDKNKVCLSCGSPITLSQFGTVIPIITQNILPC